MGETGAESIIPATLPDASQKSYIQDQGKGKYMAMERIRVRFIGGPLDGAVEQELGKASDFSHVMQAYLLYKDDPTLERRWFIVTEGDTPQKKADLANRGTTPHYYQVAASKQEGDLLELTCEYGGTERPTDLSHD
jgi:hypothetical protein